MPFRPAKPLAIALVLALGATGAIAASAAETAIATRQAGYKKIGASFKAISDELKKSSPDTKLIAANAAVVSAQAAQIPTWFPKGSGPESGFKTEAKANIWTDWPKFSVAAGNLQTQARKLQTVAGTGDVTAIKAQFRVTGGTCKACHDVYRAEK